MAAPHNISPPLQEQLVLELEAGVAILKAVKVFPGSRSRWFALPMYQDLTNATGQPGA